MPELINGRTAEKTTDPRLGVGLRPTTHVADAILAGCSAGLDAPAVEGVLDVSLSATVAACRSRHHLVDFEEFLARGAL